VRATCERLVADGKLILQLYCWESDHAHPPIGDPAIPFGNGVLLWFDINDFDGATDRAIHLKRRDRSGNPSAIRPRVNPAVPPTGISGYEISTETWLC
jgi:hypothetical protein